MPPLWQSHKEMILCQIWTEKDRGKEAACTKWAAREKLRATEEAAARRTEIKKEVNIMPGFDGTGPYGTGPIGRGLGPCGKGAGRGAGFGKGAGRGIGRGRFAYAEGQAKEERIRLLRAEKDAIEKELQELEKE